ncbi:MAG TPA: histidine kinase dimerization/phospho-acceptor domain-containing protein [Thermoanaerobaculia bacterium]|nr:histidine kinase dimerization/phospho-acceptor domain-containing protein [Thermoanaerobaculia bacterium]
MDRWRQTFAEAIFRRSADVSHDLKTPLNIAVLNLELLKMRLAKLSGEAAGDPKVREYARSVETELRRMARIFDAVFHQAFPPIAAAAPEAVDLFETYRELSGAEGGGRCVVRMHRERARELAQLVVEGSAKIFDGAPRVIATNELDGSRLRLEGRALDGSLEVGKLFKFYYTDASGNPEISLASARLIAESYGGTLSAELAAGDLVLELAFPPGEE